MSEQLKVKERPILFSGPMVRAILDGKKSQTRRIVKPAFSAGAIPTVITAGGYVAFMDYFGDMDAPMAHCPYGVPGDRLWVRETLKLTPWDGADGVAYAADGEIAWDISRPCEWVWQRNTLPSIHCPRGLSRITLEIVAVRVERLQAISHADVLAEGGPFGNSASSDEDFAALWDKINGKRAAWASNPWVWVVEFRKVSP